MAFMGPTANMLPLLYQQHHQYTIQLGQTHQSLSKLYKKLAKVERVLAEREERGLSRSDKKKHQYTRSLSKHTVANLEAQQASLHDSLRQCNDLIASYEQNAYATPLTPWTALPPSPYMFTPYSPVAFTPWATSTPGTSFGGSQAETVAPQYWDLSMLSERHQSSSIDLSADSGYYEPVIHGVDTPEDSFDATNHVYAHELMAPVFSNPLAGRSESSNRSSPDEKRDEVAALPMSPVSPAKLGAQSHKRCYSVDAIKSNQTQLVVAPTPTKRGASVGPNATRIDGDKEELGELRQEAKPTSIIFTEQEL